MGSSPHRLTGVADRAWARWVKFSGQPEDEAWQQSILYRISSAALTLQHLLVIACGLAWFIAPSNTIDKALDPAWSLSWSMIFAVFAGVALLARLRRAWPIEAASNIVVAISVWLWAMVILVTNIAESSYGGLQTSLMLLGFAASLWGWSLTQIAWVRRREAEGERFKRKVGELLAEELRKQR